MVKAIPEGYNALTAYLIVDNIADAIAFYQKAFDASESEVLKDDKGIIQHAAVQIGTVKIMLGAACEQWQTKSAKTLGGSPVSFVYYSDNVEKAFEKAKQAGMAEKMPISEQFWGDRMGALMDPFGFKWSIAQHVRDVSLEEMQKAMLEMCKQSAA